MSKERMFWMRTSDGYVTSPGIYHDYDGVVFAASHVGVIKVMEFVPEPTKPGYCHLVDCTSEFVGLNRD